jgi:O-methyltransferase
MSDALQRPSPPAGLFSPPYDAAFADILRAELHGVERMAEFIDFVIAQLWSRDHRSVFWGDRMVTLDKHAGFFDDPLFRNAYEEIKGAHVYDQYTTPFSIAWRLHTLVWAARQALALPDGDFVECGVFQGDMAHVVHSVTGMSGSGRRFFLFDSFEGFDPTITSEADYPDLHGYVEMANAYYRRPGLYDGVVARFAAHPEIVITKGFLPRALDGVAPAKIAFLHIDLNAATAEVGCLDTLFDRVVPGGLIVFDDYGWSAYRKQKEAEDAWMSHRGYSVLELPTGQGLVVKRA